MSFFKLDSTYALYNQFLSYFPEKVHGLVSLVLAVVLIYGIYKVVRRQFVYLILLVILLPASVPILKNIWQTALEVLKFLLSKK
jgi:hypothetical protein